jgi:hypothetical protein
VDAAEREFMKALVACTLNISAVLDVMLDAATFAKTDLCPTLSPPEDVIVLIDALCKVAELADIDDAFMYPVTAKLPVVVAP